MEPRQIIYSVLMWLTLIYATRRGGWTERSAAWVMVIMSLLSATVATYDFKHLETRVAIFDGMAFLALFAIGLFSERYWPLWVAALAGITLLSHLLPLMPLSNPWVYHRADALWSWPMLLIINRAIYQRSLEARNKAV